MTHLLIIPTFARPDLLHDCLQSIRVCEIGIDYRIVVVDDGSGVQNNKSLETLCTSYGALFYQKPYNEGFAKTVNYAMKVIHVSEPYITLINNDIVFSTPILDRIRHVFEQDPKIGIIGARLYYQNKTIQHAGLHYSDRFKQFIHQQRYVAHDDQRVMSPEYKIAVTGALMSIRHALYKSLHGFNEEYFLACEDTDFCLRTWKNTHYKVLYDPQIHAYHLEGQTRGHDFKSKKQHPIWTKKENESIKIFLKNLKGFNMRQIKEKVMYANKRKKVISPSHVEIGSGYNPEPGFFHIDTRKGLPQLDLALDITKEKLPFKDSSIEELLANHVIEHISFRKLPFVLKEWVRVLRPNGKLRLRTPDLEFIMNRYHEKKITPEHPDDERFILENYGGLQNGDGKHLHPGWWTNLKLFSGQDYDANFHCVCFDYVMLSSALIRFGFTEVSRVKWEKEFSPGELQVEAFK